MARRGNGNDGENNAKIKIVYFEAENVSGDLTGMIHAFTNAVRAAPVHLIPNAPAPRQIESARGAIAPPNGHTEVLEAEEDIPTEETGTASPKRSSRPRKAFKGDIVTDVDWEGGGMSLERYMAERNPPDTMRKHLVIAAWFLRHGDREAVTPNLIYNAYLILGLGQLVDWGQPLRDGSKSQRGFYKPDGKGNYTITPVGLRTVDRLGSDKPGSDD